MRVEPCGCKGAGLVPRMPRRRDESPEADGTPWDEHRWERLLQESDRRSEKYGRLLEQYADHPDADAIIAREMGWENLDDDDDWSDAGREPNARFEADQQNYEEDDSDVADPAAEQRHPLAVAARDLTRQVMKLIDGPRATPEQQKWAGDLFGGVSICGAKLHAMLGRVPRPGADLGMMIAYLKRGLKALTDALGAIDPCEHLQILTAADAAAVKREAFRIRGGIIKIMGDLRAEFRRRHG